MYWVNGWLMVGLSALALGSADAQVEPSRPATAIAQYQPQPYRPAPQIQYAPPAYAVPTGFEAYKLNLAARARREGVREATIRSLVPTLQLNSRAMQLDRAQPGARPNSNIVSPFAPYRREHVTASLISRGRSRYIAYHSALRQIEARTGVDPGVLMAIYGHETSYGSVTGNFDLLDALSSLAYEGRRRELFESEFVAALKLIDIGVPRWRLKGSYAGATGYPQFMPSAVLRLRADGDGDGHADIWSNELDAFASIANYLREAGWKRGIPWGVAVAVPPTLNRNAIRSMLVPPRCPAVFRRHSRWLTVREWRGLGIMPQGQGLPDSELATLIEPDGPGATAYLLTSNYRTILDYNCSNFYALSVGLLADAVAGR